MPELFDFEPDDLRKIEPHLQPGVAVTLLPLGGIAQFSEMVLAMGPAWTAVHDGEVIAVGGLCDAQDKTAEAWLLTTERVKRHLRWFMDVVASMLSAVQRGEDYSAVTASVDINFEAGKRFVKRLGFEYERDAIIPIGDGTRVERWVRWHL